MMSVNLHCKYTNAGESVRSGAGRPADGLTCVDRCLEPGWHVWISPTCENSMCWQRVDVHEYCPKQYLIRIPVCMCETDRQSVSLGLFTKVQPAGIFESLLWDAQYKQVTQEEGSEWCSQACRVFGVRGHIPLRLWPEGLTYITSTTWYVWHHLPQCGDEHRRQEVMSHVYTGD